MLEESTRPSASIPVDPKIDALRSSSAPPRAPVYDASDSRAVALHEAPRGASLASYFAPRAARLLAPAVAGASIGLGLFVAWCVALDIAWVDRWALALSLAGGAGLAASLAALLAPRSLRAVLARHGLIGARRQERT